jgi:electron transport complex protein RnfG
MAKKESTFINMVFVLVLVAVVAGLALGAIYNLTKEPIELAKKAKIEKAIKQVLPEFDTLYSSFAVLAFDGRTAKDSLTFTNAYENGTQIGTAIESYTYKGYSGLIKIMVGFEPDGTISNISVLEHKETPGLGTKMDEPKFKNQYLGKNPESFNLRVVKDGGEVDAITAATISSRAFSDAVDRAYQTFIQTKGGNEQ